MAAQAWFEPGDIEAMPGHSAVLPLTVVNLGDTTDSFAVVPSGLAGGWTVVRPGSVTLFGGAQQTVEVEVQPPALPTTTAGPAALSVRIIPQAHPDEVVTAETTIVIGQVDRRSLHLLQPVQRARRRATYELMVVNEGNAQANCRLQLVDLTERVHGDFDPPAVAVEPGGSSLVQLRVRAGRPLWRRPSRSVPFLVAASQPGVEAAEADGVLVQTPMLGEQLWGRLAGAVFAAGLLVGAWFGVARPAVRDAADDAVADRLGGVVTPSTTPVDDEPAPSTGEPTDGATVFYQRLATAAVPGQAAAQELVVPDGSTLQITDLIIQNPNEDDGTATLLQGDEQMFTWPLRYVFGVQPLQLVTPIEIAPGQTLTFQVTCSSLGDPAAGSCSQALSVLGTLVPTG